jgi:hypothetical protein
MTSANQGRPGDALPVETAAPARNFTISVEQQVRAAAGGAPAYIRRRRAIEDLDASVARTVAERCAEATALGVDARVYVRERAPAKALERLAGLIERHNRWYPIEANLPMHPRTGELVERTGDPWRPMRVPTLDEFLARVLQP